MMKVYTTNYIQRNNTIINAVKQVRCGSNQSKIRDKTQETSHLSDPRWECTNKAIINIMRNIEGSE